MTFYVEFTVKRGGSRKAGIEISYLYDGSRKDLSSDFTDKNGEVITEWNDKWNGKEIDVYFDGGNRRKIKLRPRESHNINLSSGCFPYHTKVSTPTGFCFIGEIAEGDIIFSFDSDTGELVERRVTRLIRHDPMKLVKLVTSGGKVLNVTENHRILTKNGFSRIDTLHVGEMIMVDLKSSTFEELNAIEENDIVEPVFNLIVEDSFTFLADGFVVHSFSTKPKLQKIYWKLICLAEKCFRLRSYKKQSIRTIFLET